MIEIDFSTAADRGGRTKETENSKAETGNHLGPRAFGNPEAHMDCEARAVLKSVSRGSSEGWPSTLVSGTKRESDKKKNV